MIKLDTYFTPLFPEEEEQFKDHIVVMIDVLRASSTICAALYNGAREIIPFDEVGKAVSVYANLSKESRFLGGERDGVKQEGFDAGNSPLEYTKDRIEDRTIIFTTSNGTKIFVKDKHAKKRFIGAFVNLNIVLNEIYSYIEKDKEEGTDTNITFLCAGTNGRVSYEDMTCAGAFLDSINDKFDNCDLTDSAEVAKNLYTLHRTVLGEFLKTKSHARHLESIGMTDDIEACFEIDKFPVVPVVDENSIKIEK
jgi:2-phosphosulfolactate phosphatase